MTIKRTRKPKRVILEVRKGEVSALELPNLVEVEIRDFDAGAAFNRPAEEMVEAALSGVLQEVDGERAIVTVVTPV